MAGPAADRVLRLSCTAEDLRPLADAADFAPGVVRWDPAERAAITAELDAAFLHLFGLGRDDAKYVVGSFNLTAGDGPFAGDDPAAAVLAAYDRFAAAADESRTPESRDREGAR